MNVMNDVNMLILSRARVAPPIRWISRWPAVIFAVSRTARAMGWINKLIVSIIISIGIRGTGVPWGRKWASDAFVLWRNPRTTVPAQRGMAIPRFIDSWVVGVKECGRRPNRFVEPMNKMSDISIRDHFWPVRLWIVIICLVVRWRIHCWIAIRRLLINRLDDGNRIVGNIIIRVTIGNPIIVGVMKEANKFSFISSVKGLCVVSILWQLVLGFDGTCFLKPLVV